MDLPQTGADTRPGLSVPTRDVASGGCPRRSESAPPGIMNRIRQIVFGHWSSTSASTATHRRNYEIAAAEFSEMLDELRTLVEGDLVALEEKLEAAGAPWTPGRRIPQWQRTTGN